jgi:hypothetical protein
MRLPASQFPISITLDSTMSMIAEKSLAQGKQIYIQARISKTGNAMLTRGDLVGTSEKMYLTSKENFVKIIISRVQLNSSNNHEQEMNPRP